jgi:hypothetical protein
VLRTFRLSVGVATKKKKEMKLFTSVFILENRGEQRSLSR